MLCFISITTKNEYFYDIWRPVKVINFYLLDSTVNKFSQLNYSTPVAHRGNIWFSTQVMILIYSIQIDKLSLVDKQLN